jgi:hypothetical protein
MRLRAAATSDKVTMNKVVPQSNVKCRTCNETLAHILGQCVYTKPSGLEDVIRDFISKKLATMKDKISITKETLIATPTGKLKFDLVVVNQERVHVVDVTVHHDDAGHSCYCPASIPSCPLASSPRSNHNF